MNLLIKNNIFYISLGTSISKLFGFLRQIIIAAAFGVGISYDAFNYAYIIPGFLIIIIGGINGPLHNAIVSILTPVNYRQAGLVLTRVSIKLTLIFCLLGLIIFSKAIFIIKLIGPNLDLQTQQIASIQLQILSPCIPLSAFIGLSYGALNSKNKFFLSSFSPSFISLTTILFILFAWITNNINFLNSNFFESHILAISTLTGTIIQFSIQIIQIYKIGLLRFESIWHGFFDEERRIFSLIIPASFSSGLGQINVFVDMFFASSFPGAASGLAYGNFLIQAPLGILSNSLILPLLPKISKLIKNEDIKFLQKSLLSSIEYSFLTTFFLAGFFISFNEQIVELVFQRGAFNYDATITVKKILIAYAIGIPFYLYRDLLIRIYYAIDKTELPFKLSLIGILLNIGFDWILIGAPLINSGNFLPYNFGISGIVIASGFVNFIICLILSIKLKIKGIRLLNKFLIKQIFFISIGCFITSSFCIGIINLFRVKNQIFFVNAVIIGIGFIGYTAIYFVITKFLKVNKFKIKLNFFKKDLIKSVKNFFKI
ncbi:MAG: murein biosynthesis integral membrane protein MurJ [Prochlorococcus sp. SP3034]|nr:murein biosynthesis integral membrane protein MurJ [Prochlorococcus sp. SP3034]